MLIEEQTRKALKDMKHARVALRKAVRQAEETHDPEARAEVQRLLDAMLYKKRQFEELAILRDAAWQQNIKRHERHENNKV